MGHPRIAVPLTLSLLCAAPAWAAEGPHFEIEGEAAAFPLEESRSRFRIDGRIARVRLTQAYANRGPDPIEAVYVFPASTGAAVHAMRIRVGSRTLEATIDRRDAARATYEAAKAQGRQAGLLEQERPDVLRMQVANIRPGERVQVEIDYSEVLIPTDGVYELVIPSVVGPRFVGEAREAEGWTENPHLPAGSPPPYRWAASGEIRAALPVAALRSPSHPISPRFTASRAVGVEVSDERGGDRDFVLRYRLGGDAIETGLLLHEDGEERFFSLTVAPPKRVAPNEILPREYVFVVDVSGSMGGYPLTTAKALLRDLVKGLRPQDRFNVVQFAGGSRVLSERSLPATAGNLDRALEVVDGMRGGGGTQLLAALERAFALPRDRARSTSFVLVTDGYVAVTKEALELIARRLGEANLFTFGIGSSVNRHLIESVARAGMGEPFVVLDPSEASPKAAAFLRYVEAPVLTDVRIDFEGFDAFAVEPPAYPDLFASRPVHVFGKYRGAATGRITVRGRAGGQAFERTLTVDPKSASDDLSGLPLLWARHRVERLTDLDGAAGHPTHEDEITELGLRYGLLTAYTSFVATSEAVVVEGGRTKTVRQPLPMPKGVPNASVGHGMVMGAAGSAAGLGVLGVHGQGRGGGGVARYAAKSAPRLGRMKTSAARVTGALSAEVVKRVLRRNAERFRHVYEKALRENPKLAGKVVLELVVAPTGRVGRARIVKSELGDEAVERALARVAERLQFPKPAGGGTVTIRYPLVFRP